MKNRIAVVLCAVVTILNTVGVFASVDPTTNQPISDKPMTFTEYYNTYGQVSVKMYPNIIDVSQFYEAGNVNKEFPNVNGDEYHPNMFGVYPGTKFRVLDEDKKPKKKHCGDGSD